MRRRSPVRMVQATVVRSEIERLDTLCAGIVVRDGEEDACCKPACVIAYHPDGGVWPACVWHAHRYGGALTLAQVAEALTTGATVVEYEVGAW